jgi:MAD (mothers against decapentaplegic) interacting protein
MDGVMSIRMSSGGTDYMSGNHLIRWTEVFLLPMKNPDRPVTSDAEDPARAAGAIARAICLALTPHLAKLKEAELTPLAVRVSLDPESVRHKKSHIFTCIARCR